MGLLGETTITVETTLFSKTFNLEEEIEAEQGLVTKLLRPKVTILQGGAPLIPSIAPAGDPADGPPMKLFLALLLALVLVWVLL